MKVYAVMESYYSIEDGSRAIALLTSEREAWRYIERCVEGMPHTILNKDRLHASAGRDEQCDDLHYGIKPMVVYDGAEHAPASEEARMLREHLAHPPLTIESAGIIKGGEVQWFDVPEIGLDEDVFKAESSE